jgi:hypothetical protein
MSTHQLLRLEMRMGMCHLSLTGERVVRVSLGRKNRGVGRFVRQSSTPSIQEAIEQSFHM